MDIYIARNGERQGPFTTEEVRRRLAEGTLLPTDLAWVEGQGDWKPLASLPGIAAGSSDAAAAPGSPPFAAHSGTMGSSSYGPPRTSGAAIASLTFGLLSFFLLPLLGGVVAIVCGHVAHGNIRKSGGILQGNGMAIAGLVLGYVNGALFLLLVPILAGIAVPVFAEVKLKGAETRSLMNAKAIGMACRAYASDHQGAFPKALEDLVPNYLQDRSKLVCPLSPTLPVGYDYFGGTTNDPPEKVLLMSKYIDHRGKRIILNVDAAGHIGLPPPGLPAPAAN